MKVDQKQQILKLLNNFWIVNISKKNVCLSDLGITVPAGKSMNLLDQKHYNYTIEQLYNSKESGSLYKKRHLIKIAKGPQQVMSDIGPELSDQPVPMRKRSAITVKEQEYEDWLYSDEKYAEEMSKEFDD